MTDDVPPDSGADDSHEAAEVLDAEMFAFELDAEVRRASRTQAQLTLLVIDSGSGFGAASRPPAPGPHLLPSRIVDVIADRVRDTDLLGWSHTGVLSLMLVDAPAIHSTLVIDRLLAGIARESFARAMTLTIGAATFPGDALDGPSLSLAALSRPIMTWAVGAADRSSTARSAV